MHKTFPSYTCYHVLIIYLSFYKNSSYNLKMHCFNDNQKYLKRDI